MRSREMVMTVEEAVDEFADMVYRIALVEVKNRTDADDIFQEVFIRLVKHIHKMESREHLKAWLIRVTINCAKKHLTSYWNQNVGSIEGMELDDDSYVQEDENPVRKAVLELPDKYRTVIHLFYFEGLSVKEICRFVGQKESAVKSQLFRAREMLKDKLEGEICL